jgi:hypothetical protein
MGVLLIGLVIGVISGSLASHVAASKGCDGASWFVLGLFFGPLALLALAGMPDRKLHRYLRAIAEKQGVDIAPFEAEPDKSDMKPNEFIAKESISKEELWKLVLSKVSPEVAAEADFRNSWFYRNLLNVRTSGGNQIARAIATPLAFGEKRWRVESK